MLNKCFFCSSVSIRETPLRRRIKWDSRIFQYFLCKECGGLSLYPKLNAEDIGKLYSKEYNSDPNQKAKSHEDYLANHGYKYSLNLLKDLTSTHRLLDFGCGIDQTISNFVKSKGAKYTGVEVDYDVVEFLRGRTTSNEYLTLKEFFQNKDKFDFIFCGDVFEHIVNPIDVLMNLTEYLKPQGYLLIQGPLENSRTISHGLVKLKSLLLNQKEKLQSPYHVSLARRSSMISLLHETNLTLVRMMSYEVWWPMERAYPHKSSRNKRSLLYFSKIIDISLARIFPKYGNRFCLLARLENLNS
jgi:2-polyprenyl-3-methyl-5-hydroxy-6-metoxy-1,4-benzoquinol methylase